MGFNVIETKNVRECEKLVSSSGEERAKEFLDLWKNEKVKLIITARGGEFLMEMLPFIDSEVINKYEPKWVQGFSDTSLLLFYLTTNFNIPTIHANNFSSYGMRDLHESYSINREDGKELEPYNLTEKVQYKNLYNKNTETLRGRLIGGCIDVLKIIAGTPFDNTKNFCEQFDEGMIWYLENCEMTVCDLYRSLWQMKMAGWFKNAKGFLIGRTRANSSIGDFTYEEVLHSVFDDMIVPVIYDVDFGHVMPQLTFVNGGKAEFLYEKGSGKISIEIK